MTQLELPLPTLPPPQALDVATIPEPSVSPETPSAPCAVRRQTRGMNNPPGVAPDSGAFLERPAEADAANPTFADVIARLEAIPDLSVRRRRDLVSALRTLARAVDRPLTAMPATPVALRDYFALASPAAAGVSRGRWQNVRDHSLAALAKTGVRTLTKRTRRELSTEWDDLRARCQARNSALGSPAS